MYTKRGLPNEQNYVTTKRTNPVLDPLFTTKLVNKEQNSELLKYQFLKVPIVI